MEESDAWKKLAKDLNIPRPIKPHPIIYHHNGVFRYKEIARFYKQEIKYWERYIHKEVNKSPEKIGLILFAYRKERKARISLEKAVNIMNKCLIA